MKVKIDRYGKLEDQPSGGSMRQATKLYLLNFTLREIAEMLSWEEDRIIKKYVTSDAMVQNLIRRLDGSR